MGSIPCFLYCPKVISFLAAVFCREICRTGFVYRVFLKVMMEFDYYFFSLVFLENYIKNQSSEQGMIWMNLPERYRTDNAKFVILPIQYEKALTYGESAIKRNGQYYDLQLKQLVGHLLFEKREFARALPYLETYVVSSEKVRREDLYELSYCYYEAKNWNKAIQGFKQNRLHQYRWRGCQPEIRPDLVCYNSGRKFLRCDGNLGNSAFRT